MTITEEVIALEKLNPLWSFYLCLATVIKYRECSIDDIRKAFKVVPTDEYTSADKEKILAYLYKISHSKIKVS